MSTEAKSEINRITRGILTVVTDKLNQTDRVRRNITKIMLDNTSNDDKLKKITIELITLNLDEVRRHPDEHNNNVENPDNADITQSKISNNTYDIANHLEHSTKLINQYSHVLEKSTEDIDKIREIVKSKDTDDVKINNIMMTLV